MNSTKGQLAEYAGLPINTVTVWIREGVLHPEKVEGRNNTFKRQELIIARILSAPYHDWGIGSEMLKSAADWLRGILGTADALGYKGYAETKAAYQKDRAAKIIAGRNAEISGMSDDERKGYLDALEAIADHAGISDWQTAKPFLNDEDRKSINYYNLFMACVDEGADGFLTLGTDNTGNGEMIGGFAMSEPETDHHGLLTAKAYLPKERAKSLILIDLKAVFA